MRVGTVTAPDAPPTTTEGRSALRGAAPIALGGLVANLANIVVTLIVARQLSVRGYGTLNQLVAVYLVLSITGSALLIGVVRRLTLWERTGHAARVAGWSRQVRGRALVAVLLCAVVAVVVRDPLAHALSISSPGGLAEMLVAGAAWGLLCLERALLQARRTYGQLGVNLLLEGVSRGVLTILFVAAGFGVTGAALGLLAGVLLAELHAVSADRIVARRRGRRRRETGQRVIDADVLPAPLASAGAEVSAVDRRRERRNLATDLVGAVVALGLLSVLQNFDVVLLGREHPGNAGSYAPVSVACKPLALAAFVLVGFLLPEAASRRHAGEHALRQLGVVLGVVALPATTLLVCAAVAPQTLLRLAFGARLDGGAPALLPLAGAMTLLAATVLFTHYLLATSGRLVLVVLGAGTVLTVGLLAAAHGSLVATARADLVGQAVLALATGALVLYSARPVRVPPSLGYGPPASLLHALHRGDDL